MNSKTSACRDGTLKNHCKQDGNAQQLHIIPTSCAILPIATTLCLLVVCAYRRVLEGSWGGEGVECMLMCMESGYVVGGCNVVAILSMADMVCLVC